MEAWITEVRKYITETTKIGVAGLAALTDYTPAVISQVLAEKYAVEPETLDRIRLCITAAIDLHRVRAAMEVPSDYVRTRQSKIIESAIGAALATKRSAIVSCDTGTGKSITARHTVQQRFGLVLVECDIHDYRAPAFMDRLAKSIGVKQGPQESVWRLQRRIEERLAANQHVVIIDDAHYMLHPDRPARSISIRAIKDLIEKAKTPFVLLGEPNLWDAIGSRDKGEWYTQLKRRVQIIQRVTRHSIQADDVESVVRSLGVRPATSGVLGRLWALAREPGGYGNVREAVRYTVEAGEKQVTEALLAKHLKNSSTVLLERRERADDAPEHQKEMAAASA